AVVTGSAHGPYTTWSQHGAARRRSSGAARAMSHASAAALLADPHPDHDRRAREGEVLPQATLDEAAVAVLEEAAGEDDEPRRPRARLRREEDPGLLAAAQRMRMRRDQLAQEGVEPAGGEPPAPGLQRRLDRRDKLLGVAAGPRGDVHPRRPATWPRSRSISYSSARRR